MSCVPPAPVALHRYCVVMKKYILFLVSLLFPMGTYAQTGWQLTTEDQQVQKLNAIESNEDGTFFQLRFLATSPSYTYSLEVIDSTGTASY